MTSLSKKGSFKLSLSQKEAIKTCTDSGQISCLSDTMGTWIQKWKGTKRKSKLKAVYKMLTSSSSSSWSQLSWFSSFSATLFAIFSVQHWSHTCAHAAGNTGCLFREIPRVPWEINLSLFFQQMRNSFCRSKLPETKQKFMFWSLTESLLKI